MGSSPGCTCMYPSRSPWWRPWASTFSWFCITSGACCMPVLIIAKKNLGPGGEKLETTELSSTTLRIGRGTNNALHLDDHSVQHHHAVRSEEHTSELQSPYEPVCRL